MKAIAGSGGIYDIYYEAGMANGGVVLPADGAGCAQFDHNGRNLCGQGIQGPREFGATGNSERFLLIGQEDVGVCENLLQTMIPFFIWIPIGVDGNGGAARANFGQQCGKPLLQGVLQEVAGDVDMARARQQTSVDLLGAQSVDRAQMSQNGAVVIMGEDHAQTCLEGGFHANPASINAAALQILHHETPKEIVTDDTAVGNIEAQTGGATSKDGAGAADGERSVVHQFLGLTECGAGVTGQDQVYVDFAND